MDSRLVEKLDDVRYWYSRDGARVLKVVSFFLLGYRGGSVRDYQRARWTGPSGSRSRTRRSGSPTRGSAKWPRAALSKLRLRG